MMTVTDFERTLRQLRGKDPFQPFCVELTNGTNFKVDRPDAIGFNNGSAAYIDAQGEVHFFNNEEIRNLVAASANEST